MAKVFSQVQGIDYDETFSPVVMLKSVRIMLAIAAFFDYEIWQMDVKTAFLNGFLKEELYMINLKVLSIQRMLTKFASSSDPFMDWCRHLGVGISALMRWVYTSLWRSLYLQESEWELYSVSNIICG